MLERYFVRPVTVDRIRAEWLGAPIEQYVGWLTERRAATRHVLRYIATTRRFGAFARARGAQSWSELPAHVDAFVEQHMRAHDAERKSTHYQQCLRSQLRVPVEQLLGLVLPDFSPTTRRLTVRPFEDRVPGFWEFLKTERGLSVATVQQYVVYLRSFQAYLQRVGVTDFAALTPAHIDTFIKERARTLGPDAIKPVGGTLRVFLRYVHRQRLVPTDLSGAVERRRSYRQRTIPRSITWEQVHAVLQSIDRRDPLGKRDYAILLLLVTYGLRAREVAALTLEDIDWPRERLRIPRRKGGHATTFPLSPLVGTAVLEYLQQGRPQTADRHVFQSTRAPAVPIRFNVVGHRASTYLRKAGIVVPRAGSHTFRHTCVQRLVDADFSFKVIGDYVGHRSPQTTQIYGKVAVETLRQLALGEGEEVL